VTQWRLHIITPSLETNKLFWSVLSCQVEFVLQAFPSGSARFFMATSSRGYLITHNEAPQSVGILLYEWSARRRDLYLTTHNTHNRPTSMPPVIFEPTIAADERSLGPAVNKYWWFLWLVSILSTVGGYSTRDECLYKRNAPKKYEVSTGDRSLSNLPRFFGARLR
jgi:hypothetical protein